MSRIRESVVVFRLRRPPDSAPRCAIMRRFRSLLALAALLVATASFAADAAPSWPQTITQDGNTLRIYPPQLDSLGEPARLHRPRRGGGDAGRRHRRDRRPAHHGADEHRRTAHRVVALSDIQVTDAQFPTAAPADATKASALAKALMPKGGDLPSRSTILLAALVQAGQTATSAPLGTTPPTIFLAEQPAPARAVRRHAVRS